MNIKKELVLMKLKFSGILVIVLLQVLPALAQTIATTPVVAYESASAPTPQYNYPSVTILDPTAQLNTTVINSLLQPRKVGSKAAANSLRQSNNNSYSVSVLHSSKTKGVSAQGGGSTGSSMSGSAILRQATSDYAIGSSIGMVNGMMVTESLAGPPPPGGGNTDENPDDNNRLPLGDIPFLFFCLLASAFGGGRKKLKL